MRFVLIVVLMGFLAACTTTPSAPQPPVTTRPVAAPSAPAAAEASSIDYVGLQRSLGMEVPTTSLGYREKAFDTCQVGYGYSGTHNCHREFMVVINVQLQCRDSEGTVAEGVTNADLTAIANRTMKWTLKGNQGTSQTDLDGYAQIMTVAARSPKTERLKIAVGNEFLYMRANEISRVVTPRPWCN